MSTSCRAVQELLCAAPPGTALAPEAAAHLATCPACRAFASDDARAWQTLEDAPVLPPPRDLAARITERVSQRHARPPARPWRALATGLAAAAAIATGILWGAWIGADLAPTDHASSVPAAPEIAYAEVFDATPPGGLDAPPESIGRLP